VGFGFDTIKTAFFSPASAVSYAMGELFETDGIHNEKVNKAVMGVIGSYLFCFLFYGIMTAVTILMKKLQSKITLYKTVTYIQYALWLIVWFLFYIQMGINFIYSKWVILLVILFLPTAFLIACGMGKTASIKNEEIIVEYEEEDA
jgi:uncharacterized protein YacL